MIEVMGRDAGFLALYVGIAVGATAVLVPEKKLNIEEDVIEKIRDSRIAGNTHFMIVVAEGAGKAYDIAAAIRDEIGIDPRVTVLGHIQRGGSPSARDRETATRMGYYAVKAFAEEKENTVICIQNGTITAIPIEDALKMKRSLQMDRYEILETVGIKAFPED